MQGKGANLSSVGSNSSGSKSWPFYEKMCKCYTEIVDDYKKHIDIYFTTYSKNQRVYQLEMEAQVNRKDRAKYRQFIVNEEKE